MLFTEKNHILVGLAPVADAFAGTVYSDVINMKGHEQITFVLQKAVGATGTSTVTVEACSNTTPDAVSAIPFKYRKVADTAVSDVPAATTDATAAGFTTEAGSNQLYFIEVEAAALADSGYSFIRMKAIEVVDSEVLGGILAILSNPKVAQQTPETAIA